MSKPQYEEPQNLSLKDIETDLQSDDTSTVVNAMLSLAYNHHDTNYMQKTFYRFLEQDTYLKLDRWVALMAVRGLAYTFMFNRDNTNPKFIEDATRAANYLENLSTLRTDFSNEFAEVLEDMDVYGFTKA
ncbi:hypothetical protein JD969_12480 [Planctomycetota bacterium]|nr:hypothetical protein JD969_12480 [Planctomycetota bacterium]